MTAALFLLAAALPLSIAGTNVALGLISALALLRINDPKPWRSLHNPVFYAVASYCLAGLVSAALGVDPADALSAWRKDFHKLWVVTALLLATSDEPAPPVAAGALLAALGLAAVAGLAQSISAASSGSGAQFVRAHAFVHPVTFGCQMVFGLLACGSFLARTPREFSVWRRPVAALALLLMLALAANQTRAAGFALVAGAVALALAEKNGRRVATVAVLAIVVLFSAWEILPTGGRTLAAVMASPASTLNPQHTRWVLWDVAWRIFLDHPWTGVGPGGYRAVFGDYFSGSLEGQRVWGSAHDLYLHQLAERGVLGLGALLAFFGIVVSRSWKAARRAPTAWSRWAWSAWAAFLILNVTENSFQTEQTATLALFAWACGEAELRHGSKRL